MCQSREGLSISTTRSGSRTATFHMPHRLSNPRMPPAEKQVQEAQCSHPRIVPRGQGGWPELPMCVTREQTLAEAHSIDEAMAAPSLLVGWLVGCGMRHSADNVVELWSSTASKYEAESCCFYATLCSDQGTVQGAQGGGWLEEDWLPPGVTSPRVPFEPPSPLGSRLLEKKQCRLH